MSVCHSEKLSVGLQQLLAHNRGFPDTYTFIFPESRCFRNIHWGTMLLTVRDDIANPRVCANHCLKQCFA